MASMGSLAVSVPWNVRPGPRAIWGSLFSLFDRRIRDSERSVLAPPYPPSIPPPPRMRSVLSTPQPADPSLAMGPSSGKKTEDSSVAEHETIVKKQKGLGAKSLILCFLVVLSPLIRRCSTDFHLVFYHLDPQCLWIRTLLRWSVLVPSSMLIGWSRGQSIDSGSSINWEARR